MMTNELPYVIEIVYQEPIDVFRKVADDSWSVFLDSARRSEVLGQYSFIGVDPFIKISSKKNLINYNNILIKDNPFSFLKKQLQLYTMPRLPDLPPFQGGMIGYFSYDLCHHLENLPSSHDDIGFPDLLLGLYDLVMAFDHMSNRAWIISTGFSQEPVAERANYARNRAHWLHEKITSHLEFCPVPDEVVSLQNITTNFTRSGYEQAIQRTIDYIYAGDIFQANITQRFSTVLPQTMPPFQLYSRLRNINPAPFAAYLNFEEVVIASASPERFLKLTNRHVETRPIKGTRPRGNDTIEDANFAEELKNSQKDNAENAMIADLLRNDLSKICDAHSVKVEKLCELETYASVHHLVSVITGNLQTDLNAIDLLAATFPGGSITGAPKIRAMEIIAEIEPNTRGPYCGSVGYIGFNGEMDTSITIRTYAIKNKHLTFGAGGGIVADSNPAREYEETLVKAKALIQALVATDSKEILF